MNSWSPDGVDPAKFFALTPKPKPQIDANRGADALTDRGEDALIKQLAALALLYDVPFAYLVPAERLLEPEQIRFFYLDQNWIRALLDGAFSIGRNVGVDTANDEEFLESVLREAAGQRNIIRPMLQGKQIGLNRAALTGKEDFICTGFLLRSNLVSGWRGLEVTAYCGSEAADKLAALRLETLSDEVLIGLYDGVIRRLEIAQPPEGLHFGFNQSGGNRTKRLRDLEKGTLVYDRNEVVIRERGNRVIDVKGTAGDMQKELGMDKAAFTSAHFALEMLQNPYTAQIKMGRDDMTMPEYQTISELEKEIMREALENNGSIQLDPSRSTHFKFFMDGFGGEENFKRQFPAMHKGIMNARNRALNEAPDREISPAERKLKSGPQDILYIAPPSSMMETGAEVQIASALTAKFMQPKAVSIAQTYVLNADNGHISATKSLKYTNTMKITQPAVQAVLGKKGSNIRSIGKVFTTEISRSGEPEVAVTYTVSQESKCEDTESIVKSVKIVHPAKKAGKELVNPEVIRVSYNRGSVLADNDYDLDNSPSGNKLNMKLPVEMVMEVNPGYIIKDISEQKQFKVMFDLPEPPGGAIYHLATLSEVRAANGIEVSADGKSIRVKLPEDWKNQLNLPDIENAVSVDLDIYGDFFIQIGYDSIQGVTLDIPITFFSMKDYITSISSIRIPKLYFQWGCMARGTMIRMADGSAKRVEDVRIGDEVACADGGSRDVTNIWRGAEENILEIKTASSKYVRLTGTHTVFTAEQGAIPAKALQTGQKLLTIDGEELVYSVISTPYNDEVYNLEFEEPTAIYADGIKAGDHTMQQLVRVNEPKAPAEYNEDIQRMVAEMGRLFQIMKHGEDQA